MRILISLVLLLLIVTTASAQMEEPIVVPNVEVREFSHDVLRIIDYDNGVICFSREYAMSCMKMQ
jgi:hypothetical protein